MPETKYEGSKYEGSEYEGSKYQSRGVATGTRPSASAGAALPWWLYSIVMLGAVLMAMGAVVALVHPALLVSPHDQINRAVHIYAGYLAARNLALAFMLLAALGLRARG